ncbi:MAG: polyprenyl synthetase family protein [bacterium]
MYLFIRSVVGRVLPSEVSRCLVSACFVSTRPNSRGPVISQEGVGVHRFSHALFSGVSSDVKGVSSGVCVAKSASASAFGSVSGSHNVYFLASSCQCLNDLKDFLNVLKEAPGDQLSHELNRLEGMYASGSSPSQVPMMSPLLTDAQISRISQSLNVKEDFSLLLGLFETDRSFLEGAPLVTADRFLLQAAGKGARDLFCRLWADVLCIEKADTRLMAVIEILRRLQQSVHADDISDEALIRRSYPALYRLMGVSKTLDFFSWNVVKALKSILSLEKSGEAVFESVRSDLCHMIDAQLNDLERSYDQSDSFERYYESLMKTALFKIALDLLLHCSPLKDRANFSQLRERVLKIGELYTVLYQYLDDVREVYGLVEGKEAGQDAKNGLRTLVDFKTRDGAFVEIERVFQEICSLVKSLEQDSFNLNIQSLEPLLKMMKETIDGLHEATEGQEPCYTVSG